MDQADPERLQGLVRQHWQSENKVHWVRDVTFDEDHSHVRCSNISRMMAACRKIAMGLMHWAVEKNMAAACRRLAAQPWLAVSLIGIRPDS
jgi:predicted transposase YbfD/YdcC